MSQPVPEPSAPAQSVFAVPAHISTITLAGGCGESHYPTNGAVDCAPCAAVVKEYTFATVPALESAPAPEQPSQASADASAPSPEAVAPVADATPARSKRTAPADDAAPSA